LEGSFESGDVVALADKEGNVFAKGKVEVSSKDLEGFKGKRHSREIVHRDNIAVLA
jgi:glutamate 5-kinase